jgi:hypothetical protein
LGWLWVLDPDDLLTPVEVAFVVLTLVFRKWKSGGRAVWKGGVLFMAMMGELIVCRFARVGGAVGGVWVSAEGPLCQLVAGSGHV